MFQELLRLMGLPETVEPRLMRTMVEAVKQHRLHREREGAEHADWASRTGAEPLSARASLRAAPAAVEGSSRLVNVGGDGNEWAVFVATLLSAIGAHVRVTLGCSSRVSLPRTEVGTQLWEQVDRDRDEIVRRLCRGTSRWCRDGAAKVVPRSHRDCAEAALRSCRGRTEVVPRPC